VPVVCVSVGADRGETILLQNPFAPTDGALGIALAQ
jgi:hypothetical protein